MNPMTSDILLGDRGCPRELRQPSSNLYYWYEYLPGHAHQGTLSKSNRLAVTLREYGGGSRITRSTQVCRGRPVFDVSNTGLPVHISVRVTISLFCTGASRR